jgi:hypothetical protein
LEHLLEEGHCRSKVVSTATDMLHIIRILELNELRVIREARLGRRQTLGRSTAARFEMIATANTVPHYLL